MNHRAEQTRARHAQGLAPRYRTSSRTLGAALRGYAPLSPKVPAANSTHLLPPFAAVLLGCFSLLCLVLFAAFLNPQTAQAQSSSPQMRIIAGLASPGSFYSGGQYIPGTCPNGQDVCILGSSLQGSGSCQYTASLPHTDEPTSPVPLCNIGYTGDGGPAINALMSFPVAVSADALGNVYIADAGNAVVRKVDSSGNMSTYAWVDGSGNVTFAPPVLPAKTGVYPLAYPSAVAVDGKGNVQIGVTTSGGVNTIAMTTDSSGNVYSLVEQLGAAYTIAGPGITVNLPFDTDAEGIAVDAAGNIYTIGTTGLYAGEILEISPGGSISIVATSAQVPALATTAIGNGIAVDSTGKIYVLAYGGPYGASMVQEFDPVTQQVTTLAGTGANGFNNPDDAAIDLGDYTPAVDVPLPAALTDINNAQGISIGPDGSLYVADSGNNMVRRIGGRSGPGCVECGPTSLALSDQFPRSPINQWALNPTLHKLYAISSSNPGFITVFNPLTDTVTANIQVGNNPGSLAVDSANGFIYVTDTSANLLYVISSTTDQVLSTVPISGPPGNIALVPLLNKIYIPFSSFTGGGVGVFSGPSGTNAAAHVTDIPLFVPSAIVADTVRNLIYVRYLGPANLGLTNYSLAVIDATKDQVTINASLGLQTFSSTVYADSMAVDESTGNVLIGDDYDQYVHEWEFANQSLSGFFGGYGGFFNYHVAADSDNSIFYTWDGYGNAGYLIPNVASGVITSTSSFNSGAGYVAVDSSTDQAYVVNCANPNGDGTFGTLTLWDGSKDVVQATLPLEIPAIATSEVCGGLLVDTSNSNPALHSAWLSVFYNTNTSGSNVTAGQVDVINGPAPAPRPAIALVNFGGTSPLQFQDVGVGQDSQTLVIGIRNTGTAPLTSFTPFIQNTQDPGSLQVTQNACATGLPLGPGTTCEMDLVYTPSAVESIRASLILLDNAFDTPQSFLFSLSSVPAVGPLTISPPFLKPGFAGQPYSQIFVASGSVGAPVFSLAPGSVLPPDLTLLSPSLTGNLTAADVGTWTFTISVTDSSTGKSASQLYVLTVNPAGSSPATGTLFGSASSGTMSFGNIETGEPSATQTAQIENNGSVNLSISGISLVGPNAKDFIESDNCVGQSLSSFSSCTFNVSFTPSVSPTANEVAELVIGSNAPFAPVYLTGTSAPVLGAPASLPVAVSVDNSNPPIQASSGNSGSGCYPPECGTGGSSSAGLGVISAGGKFVAFGYGASNLPGPPQTSQFGSPASGAYLRTTCVGAASGCEESTQYISYGPLSGSAPGSNGGKPCNSTTSGGTSGSSPTGIDSTGEFVLFESDMCGFNGSSFTNAYQIYLRDAFFNNTTLISLDITGTQPVSNGASGSSMSSNGRFFAFQSASTNTANGFTNPNGNSEVYWRDNCTGIFQNCTPSTVLVSQDDPADGTKDLSEQAAISASGRYVVYASTATKIASTPANNDTTGREEVYLYDTCTGAPPTSNCKPQTTLISTDANGNAVGGASPSVSSDGRFVAFVSAAPTLLSVTNPPRGLAAQIFLYDSCTSNGSAVTGTCTAQTYLLSQTNGAPGTTNNLAPSVSADGTSVTFSSGPSNLNTLVQFSSNAVYKYTNCLAPAAVAPCTPGLRIISVDTSGNILQNVSGGSAIDSTDQYFLFGQNSVANGAYGGQPEVFLASTAPAAPPAPIATFGITSVDFGQVYIGELPPANEAYVSLTNTGSAALNVPLLSLVNTSNTSTLQSAPFELTTISCNATPGGALVPQATVSPFPNLTLSPGTECVFTLAVAPTAPGTVLGTLNFDDNAAVSNGYQPNGALTSVISTSLGGSSYSQTIPLSVTISAPLPPVVSVAFSSPSIGFGGQTTLTTTIANPNSTVPLTNIGFGNPLPIGLVYSSATSVSNTCSVTPTEPGANLVTITGLTLAPGVSCSYSFTVTGNAAGTYTDTPTSVSFGSSGTGTAGSASLTVLASPPPVSITDQETITVTDTPIFSDISDNETIRVTDQVTVTAIPLTPPTASTLPVSSLTSISAILNGSVNPNGLATNVHFEYGLQTGTGTFSYTQSTTPQAIGSGTSAVSVSAPISGLVPNSIYHFRLVASSSVGTTIGPDSTFQTVSGCAVNDSANISVKRGIILPFYGNTKVVLGYRQTLTLTNTTGSTIAGPIQIVFNGLPSAVAVGGSSMLTCNSPAAPYVAVPLSGGSLAPGASISVIVTFDDPSKTGVTYTTEVLAGPNP